MSDVSIAVIASVSGTAVGLLVAWLMGWLRTILKQRYMGSPIDRKVKRLSGTVRRQSSLLDAVTDRQAMHAQAVLVLANAVKLGDQAQVTKSLDTMTAAENQFLAYLTSHATKDEEDEDEEEVSR